MPKCLLCGKAMAFGKTLEHRRRADYGWCADCQFAQIYPMPDEQEISEFYASGEYRLETHGVADPQERNFHEEEVRAHGWKGDKNFISPADRHLDIGSSTGSILRIIGCPIQVGVEPGPWGRSYGAFASIDDVKDTFDLVTCFHVLEHVTDPVGFLKNIRRVSSGQICIEVPKPPGWGWPHLVCFREKSLLEVMNRAGMPGRIVENAFHIKAKCELS